MPKYNILIDTDVDPDLEAGVQKVTEDYNAARPAGEPALTAEEYLTRVLTIAVASYKVEAIKEKTEVLSEKYEKATPQERANAEAALAAVEVGPEVGPEVGAGGGGKSVRQPNQISFH